ncbi:hypothetical protein LMG33818_001600 [Halomonadaceae bacterium LMG 33818]|uniref:L-tyrosine/L-tryptophan isonitrile synthase family protein n=1 Tax=Cernens ardua TaxID=3402176 RepID=UPI003EDC4553
MEATDFKFLGNVTPITNGNRVLDMAERKKDLLYTACEFRKKALTVSTEFIFEKTIPQLVNLMERNVAHRLTNAAMRATRNSSIYNVKKAGALEIATEILFDSKIIKVAADKNSRSYVHKKLKFLDNNSLTLSIGLPLFSRKPISPVKNRGHLPDIGDIHSLMRCAELAKLLSWMYDYDVHLDIYADGFKYQRACGTPDNIISDYQEGLKFWAIKLGIDNYIRVIDYEKAVINTIEDEKKDFREAMFLDTYHFLYKQSESFFSPNDLKKSFHHIVSNVSHGSELRYIFFSIASSVFYKTENLGFCLIQRDDVAQQNFTEFLAILNLELKGNIGKITSRSTLVESMILEVWNAALKYVAISLTDRQLDIWHKLQPEGIKLTIHGKPDEIQIRPTNSRFPAMTSQHSVGGLKFTKTGTKITSEYRIERESDKEIPVLFEKSSCEINNNYDSNIIKRMKILDQPFCYVPANINDLYDSLSGSFTDA